MGPLHRGPVRGGHRHRGAGLELPAHPPNNDDSDFAGVPVLFTANGQDLVGLGNKDAVFYVVNRDTGELVWSTRATNDNVIRSNFASGGFIARPPTPTGSSPGAPAWPTAPVCTPSTPSPATSCGNSTPSAPPTRPPPR